ncbi:hypothetical protein LCGC14_1110420 [marine sediment metagenome]|uniref:Uncharacterized protein n=1 Tax=marine sediment metagenome TaxID=412755 RepID=A0A0F9MUU1_9ZZZZ
MPNLLTRIPTLGLNSQVDKSALSLRYAAKGSQNIFYQDGVMRTPWGWAKLDLSSGLNSGDIVLTVFQWNEIDRTSHLMAVTTDKIFDHDRVNNEWDDKTQSGVTMDSNIDNPVSYAEVGHDDTAIYIDDNVAKANAYHHVIICDGGLSNIQRWAGRYEQDFADLVGGGGYHDGTTHRASQVSLSNRNRIILLNAREYNSSSKAWVQQNQRLRWPTIGKIETWTGTGSGVVDLYDTGGLNLWSMPLGMDHIIYQTKGIWSINYVGGTTVFDPRPVIPDLGLLAPHALVSYNNVHYFMGTDFNIHAYYGGSVRKIIGAPIHKFLNDDLYNQYQTRCWMSMGPEGNFLYVLIATDSTGRLTKAYIRNMKTEAWMCRDLSNNAAGITTISLAGSTSYIVGDTYQEALNTVSLYDDTVGDATERYADKLLDSSRTIAADYTVGVWSAGGFDYSRAGQNFHNDFTDNDMLVLFDPSATNTPAGHHFYTVYDVSTNGFSINGTQDTAAAGEHGIADNSTNVPADLSVAGADTIGFYSLCSEDSPGQTYNQALETIQQGEQIILGDATGVVLKVDETYTDDDGSLMDCRHLTPVIDGGAPGMNKRWGPISLSADGTIGGAMVMGYRTGNFETSETGWTDYTVDLTVENKNTDFFPNMSSKKVQLKLSDFSGNSFKVTDFVVGQPQFQGNR